MMAAYGLSYGELQLVLGTLEDDGARHALESDLIERGLRIRKVGSEDLAWHELFAVIDNLGVGSAFYRHHNPDASEWDIYSMLLADVVDSVRVANWQRGSGKRSEYPEPIVRPGYEPLKETFGGKPVSLEEMDKLLGWSPN